MEIIKVDTLSDAQTYGRSGWQRELPLPMYSIKSFDDDSRQIVTNLVWANMDLVNPELFKSILRNSSFPDITMAFFRDVFSCGYDHTKFICRCWLGEIDYSDLIFRKTPMGVGQNPKWEVFKLLKPEQYERKK